jgi:hypothetical protein
LASKSVELLASLASALKIVIPPLCLTNKELETFHNISIAGNSLIKNKQRVNKENKTKQLA